jgi:hypothetical protein
MRKSALAGKLPRGARLGLRETPSLTITSFISPGPPGGISAASAFPIVDRVCVARFVWACGALSGRNRRCPARAVEQLVASRPLYPPGTRHMWLVRAATAGVVAEAVAAGLSGVAPSCAPEGEGGEPEPLAAQVWSAGAAELFMPHPISFVWRITDEVYRGRVEMTPPPWRRRSAGWSPRG